MGYKPEVIYAKLNEYVSKHYRPNGLRENKHGMEKLSTIPNTVNMMLCSVHQGVMRLYPAWPIEVDARFANLRQFGAFLVASELKGGKIHMSASRASAGETALYAIPGPAGRCSLHAKTPQPRSSRVRS